MRTGFPFHPRNEIPGTPETSRILRARSERAQIGGTDGDRRLATTALMAGRGSFRQADLLGQGAALGGTATRSACDHGDSSCAAAAGVLPPAMRKPSSPGPASTSAMSQSTQCSFLGTPDREIPDRGFSRASGVSEIYRSGLIGGHGSRHPRGGQECGRGHPRTGGTRASQGQRIAAGEQERLTIGIAARG